MRIVTFAAFLLIHFTAQTAPLAELLPAGNQYDPKIPVPASVIGHEVGDWHVRHDPLVRYMEVLAESSDRVSVAVTGHTHQGRRLTLVAITSPANQQRLDALRQANRDYATGRSDTPGPLVVWLGYSIHGDEASGSNASLLTAYHLAARMGPEHEQFLEQTIVLIDPSLNPDGLGRYADWANGNRSQTPVADTIHREHNQPWPRGRFNQYWFDLNRDWILLAHPESRARVRVLQDWRPHVVGDFHEMRGTDGYFFQPGVPERKNPLTPERNVALTQAIAEHHARAFDAQGVLYFSRENFDDFYYGKGSTYPDIQGMVGILFEQSSSEGIRRESSIGDRIFSNSVRNQFTTSLSTLSGAHANADALRDYQRQFETGAADAARQAGFAAYLFGEARDASRSRAMAEILHQHRIEVYQLAEDHRQGDQAFEAGAAYLVPLDQPQFHLIRALFERRTEFEDNTFYDVSAWTFPLAFDVPVTELRREGDLRGQRFDPSARQGAGEPDLKAFAWALDWSDYRTPAALQDLLEAGVYVRVAEKPFTIGDRSFPRSTLVIPAGPNRGNATLPVLLRSIAARGLAVTPLRTGLANEGVDLGSPSIEALKAIRPLLLTGRGVNTQEAGEVWHLLDTRLGLPLTMVELERFAPRMLDDYTHLLMVAGNYGTLDDDEIAGIKDWVEDGGILVASNSGAAWATRMVVKAKDSEDKDSENKSKPQNGKKEKQTEDEDAERRRYEDHDDDRAQTVIGGAIVEVEIDTSHPLAFGLERERLPVFRRGTTFLDPSDNPYETVAVYAEQPLMAGFLGEARTRQLAGSAAIIASRKGRGSVIRLADNPNFRGFWYGTNRLYFNALYLAQIIERTPVADTESRL